MDIQYREMQKKDYKMIRSLIREAWFNEYSFSEFILNLYAKAYLYIYLSESKFRYVAHDQEKIVGFIFGSNHKPNIFKKLYYEFRLCWIVFLMLFSRPGHRGIKIGVKTHFVNKKLLKPFRKKLRNELVLFIVDKNYRKCGIGSHLEKLFVEYLSSKNEKYVHLFTDTYSNFAFYERKGYKRMSELEVDFKIKGEKEDPLPIYYLYCRELRQGDEQ